MFVKGKSGNPGGRPKEVMDVVQLARKATPMAMKTLTDIAGNDEANPAARVAAANALLDRGWGKATQPLTHDVSESLADLIAKSFEKKD
jgi:isocitrate dehydrogenase